MSEDVRGSQLAQQSLQSRRGGAGAYNYEHFRMTHVLAEAQGLIQQWGIQPGTMAPEFDLLRTDGGSLRLSALRGKLVLLHFWSPT